MQETATEDSDEQSGVELSKPRRLLLSVKKLVVSVIRKTFLYFANRLEFAINMHLTFNPILIGLVWLEWWFYVSGFWQYVLPFFTEQFFPLLFQVIELKFKQIFT